MLPKKIALMTDSCADLSPALIAEYDIHVVPMRIRCADGEYADGVDITAADVYARLHAGEMPQTSLPAGEDFERVLKDIYAKGYDGVIGVMLSSGLSGTHNLMRLAGQESGENFPVVVFDSLSGSLGQGMTVLQLAEDLRAGMGWEELTERRVPQLLAGTNPFFSVDTLEFLQKGGRIGKVSATAGMLLNIKPVLSFSDDGQLVNVAKVRGKHQVMTKLVELTVKACGSHTRFKIHPPRKDRYLRWKGFPHPSKDRTCTLFFFERVHSN